MKVEREFYHVSNVEGRDREFYHVSNVEGRQRVLPCEQC